MVPANLSLIPSDGCRGLRCWALRLFVAMAALPEPLAGSPQLESLPAPLLQSLLPLLERAPASLFPRARRLYFDKYPLEGASPRLQPPAEAAGFRTFVLRESLHQDAADLGGKLHELALVHWRVAEQAPADAVAAYLAQRWQLEPLQLEVMEESWFRDGGAWVRVTLPGADPAPPEADPDTNP